MDKAPLSSNLMKEGFALIDEGRFGDAIEVGRRLKKLRHSSAFEIIALGYLYGGKVAKAVTVLEEGVSKAERVWILWSLLGNCYSDVARFDDAEVAYQAALSRDHCDKAAVHLNRAIAFSRAGKPAEALAAVKRVKSPHLLRRGGACRIRIERELGNIQVAQRFALQLSRRRPAADECLDEASKSEIFLACALGLKDNSRTRGQARRLAFRATEEDPGNAQALEVIRTTKQGRLCPKLYQLLISGVWSRPLGKSHLPPGFFRSLQVAALSEKAAFRHARMFFPATVRNSLAIEEIKETPSRQLLCEGVYRLEGYAFYRRRNRK